MDTMPNFSFIAGLFPSLQLALDIADASAREFVRGYRLFIWYGLSGIPLFLFGNRTTWRLQAQILGQVEDEDAMAFKSSVYNECTMIAISVSIPLTMILGFVLMDSSPQLWPKLPSLAYL